MHNYKLSVLCRESKIMNYEFQIMNYDKSIYPL